MSKFYAGIGSRETPADVLSLMTAIAAKLAGLGYTLRSGAAPGADTAFERGAGTAAEIFLPWPRFNGHPSPLSSPSPAAVKLASLHHPAWDRCSSAARRLHGRNSHQILGLNLDTPVQFVICWHLGTGGTLQACHVADAHEIPIFNLANPIIRARLEAFVAD